MNIKIKKLLASLLIWVVLFVNSPIVVVGAPTPPSAPSAPSAPDAPDGPSSPAPTAPSAPSAPDAPDGPSSPSAPTPPSAPSLPNDWDDEDNHDISEQNNQVNNNDTPEEESSGVSGNTSPTLDETSADPVDSQNNTYSSGGQENDGAVGEDTIIDTGNATSTAGISTSANSNLSAGLTGTGSDSGGVSIANISNGTGSDNDASASINLDDSTIQTNSASVVNTLEQDSDTGNNSASRNTGGNNTITTGDANTTGTIITSLNTNVDGVMVNEFNIADDHVGDYVLDMSGSNCIAGCFDGRVDINNSDSGSYSDNSAVVDVDSDTLTFQENDAVVQNNMILDANSGRNDADRNTGGDNTIETGDANVAANVLTFANNNLAGNIIYNVVNIFGDLIGDIIFPDGFSCCFDSVSATNFGNGSSSTNVNDVNIDTNNTTYQFNDADIQNNLLVYANTGDNDVEKNTGGDNYIKTGDASLEAEVINIANTNIVGGDWWLVIVNEAGNWIGKIMGAPAGALFGGSNGFDIAENENGEIIVTNSGNGTGSDNAASVNYDIDNTTVQTNNATIVNNLDLSANTGGNSTSRNTNGDNSINTGDADVIANLVNFVNNNIAGGGRLFVNVINVFGSWYGNFLGPDQEKDVNSQASNHESPAIGGSNFGGNSPSSNSSSEGSGDTSGQTGSVAAIATVNTSTDSIEGEVDVDVTYKSDGTTDGNVALADISLDSSSVTDSSPGPKNINLAWLIIVFPALLIFGLVGRKVYLIVK